MLPTFSDHLGTIVVATVLGPVAAGAYFAAERIAKLLSIALIGVNQIVGPMIARSWRAERLDEVRLLVLGGSAMAFFVASIGFFAYLLVGRFALRLFDPAYSDAYGVLLILAAGQLVNAICGPNNYLLNMVGLERTYMWIMLGWGGAAVVLISLSALLFGITGAAVGAAVTMIGWNLTILYVAESHLNIGLISFFKNLKKEHAR